MDRNMILVADDDEDARRITTTLLLAGGYRSETAPDGEAAFAFLYRPDIALVIAELYLGSARGPCIVRPIKGDPLLNAVSVLVYTSYATRRDEEWARTSGCDAYLVKPTQATTLMGVVAALMSADRV
jgi:CheY-like chemotaxis protein